MRNGKPDVRYYNILKGSLKKGIKTGFLVRHLDENLRRLVYFTAMKRHCYVEQIVETALREYLSKDKTIAPFLDRDFVVDFEESFNIREGTPTAAPKTKSSKEE